MSRKIESDMSQILYWGGTIITMEEPLTVQAVLVENGRILAAGSLETVRAAADEMAVQVDLKGHTMLPAFIDPHSHFTACANATMQVDLDGADSFQEIVRRIQEFIKKEHVPAGQWVRAGGYDHNMLREKAHPDRRVLDLAAPEHPMVIQHQSGHMGAFNTPALEKMGITVDTETPQGGVIGKADGRLTGYMEEAAFVRFQQLVPMPAMEDFLKAYEKAQRLYASHGITTVQDGMVPGQMADLYRLLIQSGILELDLVAYADIREGRKLLEQFADHVNEYRGRVKFGGYKMFLDGSPQGRTAWLRRPYLPEEGKADEAYCGYPTLTDQQVREYLKLAEEEKLQILTHCNGDGACEQLIDVYRAVMAELPDRNAGDIRPVMIHAQLLGPDQLEQVKQLGILPSFFLAHVYHWGDVHLKNLGAERAEHISPAGSALKEGLRFTLHQDSPVIRPDMMETIWCAVNRRTREGRLLGEEERISVLEALKAVTVNGAYQYFEEQDKGSITCGKLADFVILEKDPLTADPMELKDIRVLATIKEGRTVYRCDC